MSTAARLLRSWVRIPPGAWMSVCCECCVLSVEVSAKSWSLVQWSPTDCDASLCVIKKPQEWGGHGQHWAAAPQKTKQANNATSGICHCVDELLVCIPEGHLHSDIHQMSHWYNQLSWWWTHSCVKHVENRNKHTWKRTVHSSSLCTKIISRIIRYCCVWLDIYIYIYIYILLSIKSDWCQPSPTSHETLSSQKVWTPDVTLQFQNHGLWCLTPHFAHENTKLSATERFFTADLLHTKTETSLNSCYHFQLT